MPTALNNTAPCLSPSSLTNTSESLYYLFLHSRHFHGTGFALLFRIWFAPLCLKLVQIVSFGTRSKAFSKSINPMYASLFWLNILLAIWFNVKTWSYILCPLLNPHCASSSCFPIVPYRLVASIIPYDFSTVLRSVIPL